MKQILLKIYGRVQGVFFRAETQNKALSLGLRGWVRNNEDGSVAACAQGSSAAIKEFIKWCKTGPSGAKVEKIKQTWRQPDPHLNNFKIIH